MIAEAVPSFHRLQLRQEAGNFIGRMFGVEQDPVEAGIGNDFGGDIAAQAGPQADLEFAFGERVLERVTFEFRH